MKKRVNIMLEIEDIEKAKKIAKLNGGCISSVLRYALTKLGDPIEILKSEKKTLISKANHIQKKINDMEDKNNTFPK